MQWSFWMNESLVWPLHDTVSHAPLHWSIHPTLPYSYLLCVCFRHQKKKMKRDMTKGELSHSSLAKRNWHSSQLTFWLSQKHGNWVCQKGSKTLQENCTGQHLGHVCACLYLPPSFMTRWTWRQASQGRSNERNEKLLCWKRLPFSCRLTLLSQSSFSSGFYRVVGLFVCLFSLGFRTSIACCTLPFNFLPCSIFVQRDLLSSLNIFFYS